MHDGKQRISFQQLCFIVVLLVLAAWLSFYQQQEQNAKISAASVFDAAATSGITNVSVTVIDTIPSVYISGPENKTYENNMSITLDVNITNASNTAIDQTFYNLDDGENITLTLDDAGRNVTTITTSFDTHTLTVFANSTANQLNSSNVTFSVNTSRAFDLNFTKFDTTSTNLATFNETDLQEIANLTLEIGDFGKIFFKDTINLTNDNMSDGPIDLDTYIDISDKHIEINDAIFTNLAGQSVTLTFYGITLSNPRVLKDSVVCPAAVCTSQSLSGQTLTVEVTGFSGYDVEDGGSGGGSGGGGGGGGGGGAGTMWDTITIDLNKYLQQTTILLKTGKLFIIYGEKEYSARIGRGDAAAIRFDFASIGVSIMLGVGRQAEIDLNNDGKNDALLALDAIEANSIVITVTRLQAESEFEESASQEQERPTQEQPQKSDQEQRKGSTLKRDLGTISVVLIIILAGVFWYVKRMRNQGMRKRKPRNPGKHV